MNAKADELIQKMEQEGEQSPLIILKSKHFRDIFLNTALLANNKHLNFYFDINLSEKEINVGFNKKSLLVFNKDLKD